ncbi:MAG: DciA family protein [Acidobacteriota bacterium]
MDSAFGIIFSLQRGTPRHSRWVVECLNGSWDKIVGRKLAKVCRPAYFKGAVLKIEITDEAWLDTVRSMQEELRERIHSATNGEVRNLKLLSRPDSG